MTRSLTIAEIGMLDAIIERYKADIELAERMLLGLQTLVTIKRLGPLIHSTKARTKDPTHLRDKLTRKILASDNNGPAFVVTPENLFEKINDLAGVRLLHLHTTQFEQINTILMEQIQEEGYKILEALKHVFGMTNIELTSSQLA